MEALEVIVGVGAVMLLGGLAGGIISGFKNRDLSFWIAWGFLFPPSILIVLLLPALKGPRPRRRTLDEEDRAAEDV